jgi:hypothetical protein
MNTILNSPVLAAAALAMTQQNTEPGHRLDGVDDKIVADSAAAHVLQDIGLAAAATVQQWCETDDLDDGEGAADRLFAMLVGIADDNKNGELDEDEQMVVETAINEAWSYMASKGVSDSDLEALFDSEDPEVSNGAAARVMEFMASKLPNGAEADDEMDDFAFGAEAQESVFDGVGRVRLDAVYKKRFSIRGGKKVVKRVRVAGVVRLNAKQKVSIRKAQMKARGSKAMAKRMRSMRVRKSMGLKSMAR